jgi:hypothetical protein
VSVVYTSDQLRGMTRYLLDNFAIYGVEVFESDLTERPDLGPTLTINILFQDEPSIWIVARLIRKAGWKLLTSEQLSSYTLDLGEPSIIELLPDNEAEVLDK